MGRVPTGDFDHYPDLEPLTAVASAEGWVVTTWSDGVSSRFHHTWLRDNCPCEACVHPGTREQTYELPTDGSEPRPSGVDVDGGVLTVKWSGDGHSSRYDSGWLRAHAYDAPRRSAPTITTWGPADGRPESMSGPVVLRDDAALLDWLLVLRERGIALLHGLPLDSATVVDVVERIGVVRDTNFGRDWDVVVEAEPESNAYTALELPPHTDLPTREYQPGLQFLHCIVNEAAGGDSIVVDGYRLAEVLRLDHPDDHEVLTTTPWDWANRSRTSDHRWARPPIALDEHGRPVEIRFGNWLRAPLTSVPFDRVPAAYAAYRRMLGLARSAEMQVRFRLGPGELMAFDNRRVLHGRGPFDNVGRRHLRGAYSERDELMSRIRVLERDRRA